ncbi:MAG: AAA family ATPase, partial [Anaerolineae bacterium]|nr:AAA family ATPase [Anaerolineae bacterium]
MTTRLFVAPAGAGKTQFCVDRARQASRELPLRPIWACLPNRAQATAFRERLAAAGGALGVEVGTFDDLYSAVLRAAGLAPARLEEQLQHRLLRAVIDKAARLGELQHYAPLSDKPGFVAVLRELFQELKQGLVEPARFAEAVRGAGPRLEELAALYATYQRWLRDESWFDGEELGWAATLALQRDRALASGWALVAVDGFDQLNPTQITLLTSLAPRTHELLVTLTCSPRRGRLAQRRFERTLARLEEALGVEAEPLPAPRARALLALAYLEEALFEPGAGTADPGAALTWLEAPNRAIEARAALRWVKQRLVAGALPPHEVAILARDLGQYAPFLEEAALEFGVPLRLTEPRPLGANPAVTALLSLLSLSRRDRANACMPDGRFPVRQTLEALRSPYFDWEGSPVGGAPLGLTADDVDLLERAALACQVVAGPAQWREALWLCLARAGQGGEALEPGEEEETPPAVASPEAWRRLGERFERLLERLTPPAENTVAGYVAFVEDLIGDDPQSAPTGAEEDRPSLRMLARVLSGPPGLIERDLSALRGLKGRGGTSPLRGLVWADAVLGQGEPISYERFLDELQGAVAASVYAWAPDAGEAVWASSAHAARGLSFRAVAILGLSEGQFPAPRSAEGLLREEDRERLAAQGLPLEPEPPGAEFTLFYEAVTRAREEVLLSRPYLGDDGQQQEPSPFWEETLRLFSGEGEAARQLPVVRVRSVDPLPLEQAASWPELVMAVSQGVQRGEAGAVAA